jgi:hypothetical protein
VRKQQTASKGRRAKAGQKAAQNKGKAGRADVQRTDATAGGPDKEPAGKPARKACEKVACGKVRMLRRLEGDDEIKGKNPKLLRFKTAHFLKAFVVDRLEKGALLKDIAPELGCAPSRVFELTCQLGIDAKGAKAAAQRKLAQAKAKGRAEKVQAKAKRLPNGDVLEAVNGHAAKAMKKDA